MAICCRWKCGKATLVNANCRAICWFIVPAALSKTIRVRVTSPAGSERERAMLSSCARCSGLNTNAAFSRPIAIGTSVVHQRRLLSLQY